MTEKTYTLRGLTAEDVFPMLKIISGIGLKEFKGCFESEELRTAIRSMTVEKEDGAEGAEIDTTALGLMVAVDVASVIIANVPKCKKEIAALPMNVFLSMIVDVVKKEEFKDFFGDVAGLFR